MPFEDEENVSEGHGVKDTQCDVDIFYNTMSKIMLALVGEPVGSKLLTAAERAVSSPALVHVTTAASVAPTVTGATQRQAFSQTQLASVPTLQASNRLANTVIASSHRTEPRKVEQSTGARTVSVGRSSTPEINTAANSAPDVMNTAALAPGNSPPVRDGHRDAVTTSAESLKPQPVSSTTADVTKTTTMTTRTCTGSGEVVTSGADQRKWRVQPGQIILPVPQPGACALPVPQPGACALPVPQPGACAD